MTSKIESTDTVLKTLQGAKGLIEKNGWIQRTGGGPGVGHCLVNALGMAISSVMAADPSSDREMDWSSVIDIMLYAIGHWRRVIKINACVPLVAWNDWDGRTKDDVLAALDRAIAKRLALLGVLVVPASDVLDHPGLVESVAGQ